MIFAQTWPEGAPDTALGPPKIPGPGGPQEQVISVFPSITTPRDLGQSFMVVYNQMVGGMANGSQYGPWDSTTADVASGTMAGPMLFFGDKADAAVQAASGLVLTPITQVAQSCSNNRNQAIGSPTIHFFCFQGSIATYDS